MWAGFVAAVRAQVTAGRARMYLNENCTQLPQPNSDASCSGCWTGVTPL